jgi:hypothetical protein
MRHIENTSITISPQSILKEGFAAPATHEDISL